MSKNRQDNLEEEKQNWRTYLKESKTYHKAIIIKRVWLRECLMIGK